MNSPHEMRMYICRAGKPAPILGEQSDNAAYLFCITERMKMPLQQNPRRITGEKDKAQNKFNFLWDDKDSYSRCSLKKDNNQSMLGLILSLFNLYVNYKYCLPYQ